LTFNNNQSKYSRYIADFTFNNNQSKYSRNTADFTFNNNQSINQINNTRLNSDRITFQIYGK
jgi:hypothetical protein